MTQLTLLKSKLIDSYKTNVLYMILKLEFKELEAEVVVRN